MIKSNLTFCKSYPTWANACVGNNGSPGNWEYSRGYSYAANLLIDQVLLDQGKNYPVDMFIYPVCFNMRHSVELRLKGAIQKLQEISKIRDENLEFNYAQSHDIGQIWNFFNDNSKAIDERYTEINDNLKTKILDIAEVDPTGQTFRYPFSTESQKHLVDVSIINFLNLRHQFNSLESDLEKLDELSVYLIDEYGQKSCTKHLSRKQIFNIAQKLPDRIKWSENSFIEVKTEIKEAFGLGSKELSIALKIIEGHYEFAPLIGVLPTLKGVIESEVIQFFNEWCKFHDISSDAEDTVELENLGIDYFAGTTSQFKRYLFQKKTQEEIWENMSSTLTPEMIAGLKTLFYFANELDFSEKYVFLYQKELKNIEDVFTRSKDDMKSEFMNILLKTNAMYNFVKSLYFLKHHNLAKILVNSYNLGTKFPWLDDARSGKLFEKPAYCGYEIKNSM
jgi:hypothetical protein